MGRWDSRQNGVGTRREGESTTPRNNFTKNQSPTVLRFTSSRIRDPIGSTAAAHTEQSAADVASIEIIF